MSLKIIMKVAHKILINILIACLLNWGFSSINSLNSYTYVYASEEVREENNIDVNPVVDGPATDVDGGGSDWKTAAESRRQGYVETSAEKNRKGAKAGREAASNAAINAAIEGFYAAVEALGFDALEEKTAALEALTPILKESTAALTGKATAASGAGKSVKAQVTNAKSDINNNQAKLKNCGDAAVEIGDEQREDGDDDWKKNQTKAINKCKKKHDISGDGQLAIMKASDPAEKKADSKFKAADGSLQRLYDDSTNLENAEQELIDGNNEAYMTAIELSKSAKQKALALLAASTNDDYSKKKNGEKSDTDAKNFANSTGAITDNDVKEMLVKSANTSSASADDAEILGTSAASCTDFDCSNVGDAFSVSYHLFIASSAIYLAINLMLKNDYNDNQNDVLNSNVDSKYEEQKYDEQTDQMMVATNVRYETEDFNERLLGSKETLKGMWTWVDTIANWEVRSKEAREEAAEAQEEAGQAADDYTDEKVEYNENKVEKQTSIVAILLMIAAACCAVPQYCTICPERQSTYISGVITLLAFLLDLGGAEEEDQEADEFKDYTDDQAKGPKGEEADGAGADDHTRLLCKNPKLSDSVGSNFYDPAKNILNKVESLTDPAQLLKKRKEKLLANSKTPLSWLRNLALISYLDQKTQEVLSCKNNRLPNMSLLGDANAAGTVSGSVSIKPGSAAHKLFIKKKNLHAKLMSGYEEEGTGFAEPEERPMYTMLLVVMIGMGIGSQSAIVNPGTKADSSYYTKLTQEMQLFGSSKGINSAKPDMPAADKTNSKILGVEIPEYVAPDGTQMSSSIINVNSKKSSANSDNLKGSKVKSKNLMGGTSLGMLEALRKSAISKSNSARRNFGLKAIDHEAGLNNITLVNKAMNTIGKLREKAHKSSSIAIGKKLSAKDFLNHQKHFSSTSSDDSIDRDISKLELDENYIDGNYLNGKSKGPKNFDVSFRKKKKGRKGRKGRGGSYRHFSVGGDNGKNTNANFSIADVDSSNIDYSSYRASEYDSVALEKKKEQFKVTFADSLWEKVTKTYIRAAFPVLLKRKKVKKNK